MQGCIESTPSSEDSTTLLYWEKSVIEPLIEFIGLEGFRPIVNNVQTLIASGVFRNFREVELKLIYDAQVGHPKVDTIITFINSAIALLALCCKVS